MFGSWRSMGMKDWVKKEGVRGGVRYGVVSEWFFFGCAGGRGGVGGCGKEGGDGSRAGEITGASQSQDIDGSPPTQSQTGIMTTTSLRTIIMQSRTAAVGI
jgi:hypothetical protein